MLSCVPTERQPQIAVKTMILHVLSTISVFAMISMTGIKLINNSKMNYRNTSIVGLAIALGMGVTQANAALAQLPAWVTTIFGKSPVALSTLVAVFLNLVLPKEKEE